MFTKVADYIIENKFKNNKKLLVIKTITFSPFQNIPDNLKLILLKIIADAQRKMLRSVVLHLPSRKSGK
jgi:hypothetical protein